MPSSEINPPTGKNEREPLSFSEMLASFSKRRLYVSAFVALVTLSTALVTLFMPNKYTAEVTILPEFEKSKLLGLTGVSDLAAVTGLSLGETPVSKLYPMIIKSARILREIVHSKFKTEAFPDSVDLIGYWRFSNRSESARFEASLNTLRDRMDVSFDARLGTLLLKVEMEETKLAAEIANRITLELDNYTRTKRKTSVTLQREFIQQRLVDVEDKLKLAEDNLKSFREKNRGFLESPQLLMERGRLERDVQINSTIFIELKKQIEIAKIEEIKNIPVIHVLDEARIPIKKSSPNRTGTVLLAFLIALAVSTTTAALESSLRGFVRRTRVDVLGRD